MFLEQNGVYFLLIKKMSSCEWRFYLDALCVRCQEEKYEINNTRKKLIRFTFSNRYLHSLYEKMYILFSL